MKYSIDTLITKRNTHVDKSRRGVLISNLTPVQIEHNQRPSITQVEVMGTNVSCRKQQIAVPKIKVGTWNARSMTNKVTSICDLIISEALDILVVTESWMRGNTLDDSVIADLSATLPDFNYYQLPRLSRGGGVFVLYHHSFKVTMNKATQFKSFEHLDLSVSSGSSSMNLFAIYRPYPSAKNKFTSQMFFQDFSSLLEESTASPHRVVFTGDFNFHVDDETDKDAMSFIEILNSTNLHQHIQGPTHIAGHTLDLMISRNSDHLICSTKVIQGLPSDHYAVIGLLDFTRPEPSRKSVVYRRLRDINLDQFKCDIQSALVNIDSTSPNFAVLFNDVLRELLDKHAPQKTKVIRVKPNAPWYTDKVREARRVKRRLERKMTKSNLQVDKDLFLEQCKMYKQLIEESKCSYYRTEISVCNDKQLFQKVNKLCSLNAAGTLPDYTCARTLANEFASFFHGKVDAIRDKLDNMVLPKMSVNVAENCTSSFVEFEPVTEDCVRDLVMQSSSSTCDLDPLPTSLLKDCLDILVPYITKIINESLSSGIVPSIYKLAHVKPLIKKQGSDVNDLKNYRPIANLMFISKILEKAVSSQLKVYLHENGLYSDMQSAYRQFHSTETAMLRVVNDLLLALDKGNEAVLILLDYSAAFDTITHSIFFERLQSRYGIGGTVLRWFKSYLTNRSQAVVVNDRLSDIHILPCGTPQGSVKGPLDFILYTGPLSDVIGAHSGIMHMIYADDTQLYLVLQSSKTSEAINKLESCISDVRSWAITNRLMLNDSKTEIVHFHSKHRTPSSLPAIVIGDARIDTADSARDLGVTLDRTLQMKDHIRNIARSASFGIYKIGRIRRYLDQPTTERLVHAFVSTRLDCNNSLLCGLPFSHIAPLQRVQNSAARLVTLTNRYHHISPVLNNLHWLKVKDRIRFKILLITYKIRNGMAPKYLEELISDYNPSISLRSSSKGLLSAGPRSKTMYGNRAFAVAAPRMWNSLPVNVRNAPTVSTFKTRLKTYLFCQSE